MCHKETGEVGLSISEEDWKVLFCCQAGVGEGAGCAHQKDVCVTSAGTAEGWGG
jgi:hypothetical protein